MLFSDYDLKNYFDVTTISLTGFFEGLEFFRGELFVQEGTQLPAGMKFTGENSERHCQNFRKITVKL